MDMNLVEKVTSRQIRNDIPNFSAGDTVRVSVRIVENKKERIQAFEGVVISRQGHGVSETFTVRKISSGIGDRSGPPRQGPSREDPLPAQALREGRPHQGDGSQSEPQVGC